MAYYLSPEECSMVGIMRVFGKDSMDSLVLLTDEATKATFLRLHSAMQAMHSNDILYSSVAYAQRDIWAAIDSREADLTINGLGPAIEAAAELLVQFWPNNPKPVTEQPRSSAVQNADQVRRRKSETFFQYGLRLIQTINTSDMVTQNRCWTYNIARLYNKLCWYNYELSNYTAATSLADRGLHICSNAMNGTMINEENAKLLTLTSELQQARAVIATDLGISQTAMTFGEKQLETQTVVAECASGQQTRELATAYVVIGRIMILTNNYAAAEMYFVEAEMILPAVPEYHKLQLGALFHGRGWIHLLKGNLQKAEDCFSEGLHDRAVTFGPDDTEGIQTAEFMYALGCVCSVQNRMVESFRWFSRGMGLLELVTGTVLQWNVAKMGYKLAGHYMQKHDLNSAYTLLLQCDAYYRTAPHFSGLRARVQFRLSQLYAAQGQFLQAQAAKNEAWNLRKLLLPADLRGPDALGGLDFDSLVVFWCR